MNRIDPTGLLWSETSTLLGALGVAAIVAGALLGGWPGLALGLLLSGGLSLLSAAANSKAYQQCEIGPSEYYWTQSFNSWAVIGGPVRALGIGFTAFSIACGFSEGDNDPSKWAHE